MNEQNKTKQSIVKEYYNKTKNDVYPYKLSLLVYICMF